MFVLHKIKLLGIIRTCGVGFLFMLELILKMSIFIAPETLDICSLLIHYLPEMIIGALYSLIMTNVTAILLKVIQSVETSMATASSLTTTPIKSGVT